MKRKGICFVCGCTEREACRPNGCTWANLKQTICSECAPLSLAERAVRRSFELERLQERKADLEKRIAVLTTEGV